MTFCNEPSTWAIASATAGTATAEGEVFPSMPTVTPLIHLYRYHLTSSQPTPDDAQMTIVIESVRIAQNSSYLTGWGVIVTTRSSMPLLLLHSTGRGSLAADGRSGARTASFSISPFAAATPTPSWRGFAVERVAGSSSPAASNPPRCVPHYATSPMYPHSHHHCRCHPRFRFPCCGCGCCCC